MEPAVSKQIGPSDPRAAALEIYAYNSLKELYQSIGAAKGVGAEEDRALQSLHNLIELHAAAAGMQFVDAKTAQMIQEAASQVGSGPCVLTGKQIEALKCAAENMPPRLTLLPSEVIGYRAGRAAHPDNQSLAHHSLPERAAAVDGVSRFRLPGFLSGSELVTVVESLFERVHQSLHFACLEIARYGTSDRPQSESKVLEVVRAARESRDHLLSITDYDIPTSRKIFWLGELERGEYYPGVRSGGVRTELYFHHDRFRLGRIEKAREEFKMLSDALFELCECYVTGAAPLHPVSVNRFGMGTSINAGRDESGLLPIIVMEAIADEMEGAFSKFKHEALRTKSEKGKIVGANRSADMLHYADPHTLEIHQDIECRLYRGVVPDELLRRCVALANATVRRNPMDPGLSRGGLTVDVEFEKLHALVANHDFRLSTISVEGTLSAFELVFLGRDALLGPDFEAYFDAHPFHLKKSGYLKLAVAAPDVLKEFVEREIKESPFDILHRRMTSELQARNDGISIPGHKTRYLLTQIRTEPVENRASVNAALRNYGLKSGIVTSSLEDDGIARSLEFYLLPLSFSGFFNTHMNY